MRQAKRPISYWYYRTVEKDILESHDLAFVGKLLEKSWIQVDRRHMNDSYQSLSHLCFSNTLLISLEKFKGSVHPRRRCFPSNIYSLVSHCLQLLFCGTVIPSSFCAVSRLTAFTTCTPLLRPLRRFLPFQSRTMEVFQRTFRCAKSGWGRMRVSLVLFICERMIFLAIPRLTFDLLSWHHRPQWNRPPREFQSCWRHLHL